MSNPIRKLVGQTAIYGLPSILGRLLNYLLVPLHTYYFAQTSDYGVISELYAWVAFLIVLLTFGMETAFFRFINKDGYDITGNLALFLKDVSGVAVSGYEINLPIGSKVSNENYSIKGGNGLITKATVKNLLVYRKNYLSDLMMTFVLILYPLNFLSF